MTNIKDESNEKNMKKKFRLSMPHSYIVVGLIVILAAVMTYLVPAGEFDRVEDLVTGRMIVQAESFHYVQQSPVGPFAIFKAIFRGMVDAADIIFFVLFSYGFVSMVVYVGAFDAGLGALIKKIDGKERFLIPILMLAFGAMGASFGMYEEAYGFVPVVMAMSIAMGYDGMVGAAIVFVGVATGFAAAVTNPFSIGIAQGIAKLPLFSGFAYRFIIWLAFMALIIWYTMRYAKKVKNDPSKSVTKDLAFNFLKTTTKEEIVNKHFTRLHKISLVVFVATIVTFVYGTVKFEWYLEELSAIFMIMTFVIGRINRYTFGETCNILVESSKNALFGVLIIGLARGVLIVLQDGHIIDTIAYKTSLMLSGMSKYAAGLAMIAFQNLLNFFIPSGSGQAATSMPIMTPISDLIGINRQIAVLAFQFGDGFSNLFWPTQVAIECAIAGIPLARWYKFFGPLFAMMLGLQAVFMIIAVAINYGPF